MPRRHVNALSSIISDTASTNDFEIHIDSFAFLFDSLLPRPKPPLPPLKFLPHYAFKHDIIEFRVRMSDAITKSLIIA